MLSNRWLKDHARTAENCQILYANFMFFLKTSSERLQQSFFLLLSFHLHCKIVLYQAYSKMLQSFSLGCSLANRHTVKDSIIMQTRLIARSALSGY